MLVQETGIPLNDELEIKYLYDPSIQHAGAVTIQNILVELDINLKVREARDRNGTPRNYGHRFDKRHELKN
jgi:hypothetical protein